MSDTVCEHRQWVWEKGSLGSIGQPVGTADLEIGIRFPDKGFKGKVDIEYFNQYRRNNFGDHKILEGMEGAQISTAVGISLVDWEHRARASRIFPLELEVTVNRQLPAGQWKVHFRHQVLELHMDRQDIPNFLVPKGLEKLKPSQLPTSSKAKER